MNGTRRGRGGGEDRSLKYGENYPGYAEAGAAKQLGKLKKRTPFLQPALAIPPKAAIKAAREQLVRLLRERAHRNLPIKGPKMKPPNSICL